MDALLLEWWPILVVIGGGLVAWGQLNNRLSNIEKDRTTDRGDHDMLIQLRTEMQLMRETLQHIEAEMSRMMTGRNTTQRKRR